MTMSGREKEKTYGIQTDDNVMWYVMFGRYATPKVLRELQEVRASSLLPYRLHDFFVPTEYVAGKERLVAGSYIFLKASKRSINAMKADSRVTTDIRYVSGYLQRTTTISDEEVRNFREVTEILNTDVSYTAVTPEMKSGDHVRIIRGPFAGKEGILQSKRGNRQCTVVVTLGTLLATSILSLCLDDLQYLDLPSASRNRKRLNEFLSITEDALLHVRRLTAEEKVRLQHLIEQYSDTVVHGRMATTHAKAMCNALRALGQDDTVRYEKYLRKSLELGD